MDEKAKIAVCIHGVSNVDFRAYENHLRCLGDWAITYDVKLITVRNLRVAQARNEILDKAKDMDVEFLFFLDTDHVVDPTSLMFLLEHMKLGAAMASGVVCRRGDTYKQIGYICKEDKWFPVSLPLNGLSYEVTTCAFGCNIFRLEEALKLEHPIFADVMKKRKDGKVFNMRSDINFCRKLADVTGKKMIIDTRVLVGHIGDPLVVYPSDSNIVRSLVRSGAVRL